MFILWISRFLNGQNIYIIFQIHITNLLMDLHNIAVFITVWWYLSENALVINIFSSIYILGVPEEFILGKFPHSAKSDRYSLKTHQTEHFWFSSRNVTEEAPECPRGVPVYCLYPDMSSDMSPTMHSIWALCFLYSLCYIFLSLQYNMPALPRILIGLPSE